jgi:hypothetical protein
MQKEKNERNFVGEYVEYGAKKGKIVKTFSKVRKYQRKTQKTSTLH